MVYTRFILEGDPQIAFLSDVERIIELVDDHRREHLANMRCRKVYDNDRHAQGIIEYVCDTEEDNYAIFNPMSFVFLGVQCVIRFENGFDE